MREWIGYGLRTTMHLLLACGGRSLSLPMITLARGNWPVRDKLVYECISCDCDHEVGDMAQHHLLPSPPMMTGMER
ncbi:hypothetical protein F5Y18DRAFT_341330 [Xylariaceae sp. FL1019]|nr:hypothetical protein F5Y18DRAFT_341330 [Xylariaceae sp. FL1019]